MTHQQLYEKIKKTSTDAYLFSETAHIHNANSHHKITKSALKKALSLSEKNQQNQPSKAIL